MALFQGHQLVEFRDELGAVRSGLEPFPRVFFIARVLMREQYVEVRKLTARALLGAVLRNVAWDVFWGLRRLAWRVGFIDFDERRMTEANYRGDWRWRWWLPRAGRAPGPPPPRVDVVCPQQHVYHRPTGSPAELPCPFCLVAGAAEVQNPSLLRWSGEDGSLWEPAIEGKSVAWKQLKRART